MKYNEKINVEEWNQKFYNFLIENKVLMKDKSQLEDYHKDIYSLTGLLQNFYFAGFDCLAFEIEASSGGLVVALVTDNPYDYKTEKPFYDDTFDQEIDYDNTLVITSISEDKVTHWFNPNCKNESKELPKDFTDRYVYEMYCCFVEFFKFITKE
jgi:hypothetical protein